MVRVDEVYAMIYKNEKKVYDILNQLGIIYTKCSHVPVYTVHEANLLKMNIIGQQCKNLFVRNKKGDMHYLIITAHEKRIDLKSLSRQTGSSGLSFASEERLMKYLGLAPGAVSPFGLINDLERHVEVFIDDELKSAEYICFHPNVNTATISISYADFEKYLAFQENKYTYIKI